MNSFEALLQIPFTVYQAQLCAFSGHWLLLVLQLSPIHLFHVLLKLVSLLPETSGMFHNAIENVLGADGEKRTLPSNTKTSFQLYSMVGLLRGFFAGLYGLQSLREQ